VAGVNRCAGEAVLCCAWLVSEEVRRCRFGLSVGRWRWFTVVAAV
jgi:hypothetical protein